MFEPVFDHGDERIYRLTCFLIHAVFMFGVLESIHIPLFSKKTNSKTFSVGKARRAVTTGCACARACIRAKGPRLVAKVAAHEVVVRGVGPPVRRLLRRDVQRRAARSEASVWVHEAHHLGAQGIVIIL